MADDVTARLAVLERRCRLLLGVQFVFLLCLIAALVSGWSGVRVVAQDQSVVTTSELVVVDQKGTVHPRNAKQTSSVPCHPFETLVKPNCATNFDKPGHKPLMRSYSTFVSIEVLKPRVEPALRRNRNVSSNIDVGFVQWS